MGKEYYKFTKMEKGVIIMWFLKKIHRISDRKSARNSV
ncbi:hypothetical protein CAMSH0001_1021 [Campylobacter showae RM3277]|uniref:Uncharacterized protein n=1 Tax=Campylobacter showae RM3277 TaxID=553219 RepID=C6RHR7_9BACT|nr:hypothetical protein CAMSH0001_1021 [Campylobacter showae RM3277]